MRIAIRSEQPGDASMISDLVQRAYQGVSYSDHREHLMIERLREGSAYIAELSLIAGIEGQPAGHILLTRAFIRNGEALVPTLALAPLSVVPEFQEAGVGSALVCEAHARAAGLGFGSVVLVGIPDYYPRFGYEPLDRYPIALPFDAPARNSMILPLREGALAGVSGSVDYAPGWLVSD